MNAKNSTENQKPFTTHRSPVTIITADFVLPISSAPLENGVILIENGRIVGVGKSSELKMLFPKAEVKDFGEAAILPAFVNAHSHLELSALRGFLDNVEHDFSSWLLRVATSRDTRMTAQDVELSALLGAVEGVKGGVTCFGDIGKHALAGMRALKKTGLRGISFQENDFAIDESIALEEFTRIKEKVEELKKEENELVRVGITPHTPFTVSRKLFELLTELAITENFPLTIHVAESQAEDDFMLHGAGSLAEVFKKLGVHAVSPKQSTVAYLNEIGVLRAKPLLAHCVRVSESDLEIIAETGTKIAHCPKSNAKFGHGVAPLRKFFEKGITAGLGSDSVASNNSCDLLEEARFAAMLGRIKTPENFVTAREVLEIATLGGAKCLGLENEIGSFEVGKSADFIVVALNNLAQKPIYDVESALVFASGARDIRATFVKGNAIYADGKVLTVDETELNLKLQELKTRIVQ